MRFQLQVKCPDGSCMNALQLKLFVVFTGKTYGLKVLEFGKPILVRWWSGREDRRHVDGQGHVKVEETAWMVILLVRRFLMQIVSAGKRGTKELGMRVGCAWSLKFCAFSRRANR